jgi:hypothetical protein
MIVVLAAKYIEREALEVFLGRVFPGGQASVKVSDREQDVKTNTNILSTLAVISNAQFLVDYQRSVPRLVFMMMS